MHARALPLIITLWVTMVSLWETIKRFALACLPMPFVLCLMPSLQKIRRRFDSMLLKSRKDFKSILFAQQIEDLKLLFA